MELFEISDIINGRNELAIKARKNFNREMAMEVKKKKSLPEKSLALIPRKLKAGIRILNNSSTLISLIYNPFI